MVCQYWYEEGREICKLNDECCICGGQQDDCTYEWLLLVAKEEQGSTGELDTCADKIQAWLDEMKAKYCK